MKTRSFMECSWSYSFNKYLFFHSNMLDKTPDLRQLRREDTLTQREYFIKQVRFKKKKMVTKTKSNTKIFLCHVNCPGRYYFWLMELIESLLHGKYFKNHFSHMVALLFLPEDGTQAQKGLRVKNAELPLCARYEVGICLPSRSAIF